MHQELHKIFFITVLEIFLNNPFSLDSLTTVHMGKTSNKACNTMHCKFILR